MTAKYNLFIPHLFVKEPGLENNYFGKGRQNCKIKILELYRLFGTLRLPSP